jgi:hypothetical protein
MTNGKTAIAKCKMEINAKCNKKGTDRFWTSICFIPFQKDFRIEISYELERRWSND